MKNDLPPELMQEGDPPLSTTGAAAVEASPAAPSEQPPSGVQSNLIGQTMDSIERWAIEETLKLTAGNREEAAKILAIGARTLYRKLDKYRHDDQAPEPVHEPEDE